MPVEMLVALHVTDRERYAIYRDAIAPLLQTHGGSFGYDFVVSEVLQPEDEAPINRVFTLRFPSEEARTSFFADPSYAEAKSAHFSPSVARVTRIARYNPTALKSP